MNQSTFFITALIGFIFTVVFGKFLVPFLSKLKFGQTILDIGPSWHKDKQGTPTMGGIMFIFGTIISIVIGFFIFFSDTKNNYLNVSIVKVFFSIVMALGFCVIGFIDDYVKILRKQNEGLTSKQKIILQIIVSCFYVTMLYLNGDTNTIFSIPFIGQVDFGFFYYPTVVVIILAMVNSVNLTDGVDGLATMVTFFVSVGIMFISSYLGFFGETLMSTAVASSCLGFLVFNFYPAKVFMGDTGSMFLGAIIVSMCINMSLAFLLPFLGIIYLCESLSVILQVISFKTTGKRIFKMSPIHHHFEMSGYSEVKIVILFSLITIIGSIISYILVFNRYI